MPRQKAASAHDAYHHGALRDALVEATEAILAERGLEGFTLREAARRVGVSAAAPLHHFGSAAGLLTEVAILGFEALTRHLREGARSGGNDPGARLRAQGTGYVRFALAHPARFQHAELQPRNLLQRQRHGDAGRAGADDRDIQAVHQAFLFFAPPWRALKRGLDLQIT